MPISFLWMVPFANRFSVTVGTGDVVSGLRVPIERSTGPRLEEVH